MNYEQANTPIKNTLYLGLDVHKDSITIALAEGRRGGEVRLRGTITHDLHAVEKALMKFARRIRGRSWKPVTKRVRAGLGWPGGWQLKIPCTVVAPSMIPKRSGDKIKTDQRDALKLARLWKGVGVNACNTDSCNLAIPWDLLHLRQRRFLLRHGVPRLRYAFRSG